MKDYSLAELERLTGYSGRRIRQYMKAGCIKAPELAGSRTRYSRDTLGRLVFIAELRKGRVSVREVKEVVRELTEGEIQAWAESVDPVLPVLYPVQPPVATPPPVVAAAAPVVAAAAPVAALPVGGQRWIRFGLVPGLELLLLEDGGELATRLAEEIRAKYQAGARD
jgi:DNA-binding transcriptional MerR regulator